MPKHLLSCFLIYLSFLPAAAQVQSEGYTVELQTDKKVIYTEKLGLPDNTPLIEFLQMIPELVVREGEEFLEGYDIFLDSKSVAYNKNVLLATMKLQEIQKIEISTSATASQQRNGMAGSVKIVSRDMAEGLSGTLTTNASTLLNVTPNLNVNYRSGKVELRGNVGLQYLSANQTYQYYRESPFTTTVGKDTVKNNYFEETARIHFQYSPSGRDKIKLWVLESFDLGRKITNSNLVETEKMPEMGDNIYVMEERTDTVFYKGSSFNFSALSEYEHLFRNNMKFNLSADYIQERRRSGEKSLEGAVPEVPQTIRAEVKFTAPFLSPGVRSLDLEIGGNAEYGINDFAKTDSRTLYSSPFATLKLSLPGWKAEAGFRYQYYGFDFERSSEGLFSKGRNDFTFNFNSLWQIAAHHALRFFVTKNVIHPTFEQMYPSFYWDLKRGTYICGNKSLKPASMYSFNLEYITDWAIGEHSFIADASAGFDRVDGLVNTTQKFDGEYKKYYLTYVNTGINNILTAKANLIYTYGIFSVSLAGNWYHNFTKNEGTIDNIDNFNIACSPIFSFHNNWTLSGTLRYNNGMTNNTTREGECIYARIRVNKTFGRWILSAAFSDIFGYLGERYEYTGGSYIYTEYDQYPRYFEIGATYRIGH